MCILRLGENGLKKYRLAKKWEQFKIVLLFMDHPVSAIAIEHLFLFQHFNFRGNFLKRKKCENIEIFQISRSDLRDSSFVALLILHHVI